MLVAGFASCAFGGARLCLLLHRLMSEEAKPAESTKDPLLSLDSLDLGPAWARGEPERKGGGESLEAPPARRRGVAAIDGRRGPNQHAIAAKSHIYLYRQP